MTGVLVVVAGVVALDQMTKAIAAARLAPGVPVDVVGGVVTLVLTANRGLAFGILGHSPGAGRWFAGLLAVLALTVLWRDALPSLTALGWSGRAAIGLIVGGALGNLIDRARLGAVIDFVDLHWRDHHWWTFNAADAAITVGVVVLTARMFLSPTPEPPPTAS